MSLKICLFQEERKKKSKKQSIEQNNVEYPKDLERGRERDADELLSSSMAIDLQRKFWQVRERDKKDCQEFV